MRSFESLQNELLSFISQFESCAVAMSAGVDSTVVAKAAHLALCENSIAVTATSASLASGELDDARRIAAEIGIVHRVVETNEFDNPLYVQNSKDRCYHCKTELYSQLDGLSESLDVQAVFNGTNTDDLGDYRPGLKAASEPSVVSPLAEWGMNKRDVRVLAEGRDLPTWDKPASPCLSSRIAYGEEVTPERLQMVDQAEQWLKENGFVNLRVRYHGGDIARIEVPADEVAKVASDELRVPLVTYLKEIGFKFVSLDLSGFESGSLNQLVNIEVASQIDH
ncbi:MAG: ATP-dependent sacrificial sulfur transferase LarE [Pirellulaceae bacterium]